MRAWVKGSLEWSRADCCKGRRAGSEPEAVQAIDAVKARFGSRPAAVEIIDPQRADIRIIRPVEASASRVDTIHVVQLEE
jgi:hypothetical protein